MDISTNPIFQEVPDEIDESWAHGVLIGDMATENSDVSIAQAYWWAAERLIVPALESGEAWRSRPH